MNKAAFYKAIRGKLFGASLDQSEVDGCEALLAVLDGLPLSYMAYGLATPYLETGGTMQPIKEWGGPAYFKRMYDIQGARPQKAKELGNIHPGDGVKYCGRGYPQVTGRNNYAKAEAIFGIPFVADPDLMLDAGNAGKVMRHFMERGLFTGKKFSDYLPEYGPATLDQFRAARRIINGQDRSLDIAKDALVFQDALVMGGVT